MKRLVFFLFFFCRQYAVFAHLPFIISDTLTQGAIYGPYLSIYQDPEGIKNIYQVSDVDFKNKFLISSENTPTNFNTEAAYWLHFNVINKASPDKIWLLEFFDHNINEVTVYHKFPDGRFQILEEGNQINFKSRKFQHKNLLFNLNISTQEQSDFYIRIKSSNKNVIKPEVRSLETFLPYAVNEYFFLGIFYGILVIISFYNLLLFLLLKLRFYLFYTLYILSVFVYTMCQNGLAFNYLWPRFPDLNNFSNQLSFFLTFLFLVMFIKTYLSFSKEILRWNKWLNVVISIRIIILITSVIFFKPSSHWIWLDFSILTATYVITWYLFLSGKMPFKYFLVPLSLIYFTFLINVLEQYDLVPSGILTVYSFNIGMALEIVILSVSLAFKMKNEISLREKTQLALLAEITEKEFISLKVNRELEEKVKQRTVDLDAANLKLAMQVEKTNEANKQLDLINFGLKQNVSAISQKRILKPIADFKEFLEAYPNDQACYRYLAGIKAEKGFLCKICSSLSSGKGKELFDRRCTRCGYNESVTSNTLYHKVKFPILKAFYITHLVIANPKITAEEMSLLIKLRKETCSVFKRKILDKLAITDRNEPDIWTKVIL